MTARLPLAALIAFSALALAAGPSMAQAVAPPGPAEGGGRPSDEKDPGTPFDDFNQPAPRGQEPGAWQTWTTGQKISRTERVSITLMLGAAYSLMGEGAEVFDDNGYDEFWKTAIGGGLDVGFTLMPSLNIYVGAAFQIFLPGHLRIGTFRYEPDQLEAFQFFGGFRFRLPVNLIGKKLFSIAKAECGYGFVPYLRFGIGQSMLKKVDLEEQSSYSSIPFYRASDGLFFTFGLGAELRGRAVGGFIETFFSNLGTPEFDSGITTQKAGGLKTMCLVIGLAFYI